MKPQPELALVSTLDQDDSLLKSLVAQLLEYGIFFTGLEEQRVSDTVPEDLEAHRALVLTGEAFDAIIPATCSALKEVGPDWIAPAHCTGWRAVHALAAAMPEAFIQSCVGTRFELRSG